MKNFYAASVFANRSVRTRVVKGASIFALVAVSFALSGCGIGNPGYDEFVDGNFDQSHNSFVADYKNHPENPVAQLNMGDSYLQRGEMERANQYFHQAAESGKSTVPDGMTETHDTTTTIAEVACRHLAEASQRDANCPSQNQASAE